MLWVHGIRGEIEFNNSDASASTITLQKIQTEVVNPDWNESNESSPQYIKNRTHYTYEQEAITATDICTFRTSSYMVNDISLATPLVTGLEYNVYRDGTKVCTSKCAIPEGTTFQQIALDSGVFNVPLGTPSIGYYSGPSSSVQYRIERASADAKTIVHPLDVKYIPDVVLTKHVHLTNDQSAANGYTSSETSEAVLSYLNNGYDVVVTIDVLKLNCYLHKYDESSAEFFGIEPARSRTGSPIEYIVNFTENNKVSVVSNTLNIYDDSVKSVQSWEKGKSSLTVMPKLLIVTNTDDIIGTGNLLYPMYIVFGRETLSSINETITINFTAYITNNMLPDTLSDVSVYTGSFICKYPDGQLSDGVFNVSNKCTKQTIVETFDELLGQEIATYAIAKTKSDSAPSDMTFPVRAIRGDDVSNAYPVTIFDSAGVVWSTVNNNNASWGEFTKISTPVKPETKTDAMTQPVGVDTDGKLWCDTTPAGLTKQEIIYLSSILDTTTKTTKTVYIESGSIGNIPDGTDVALKNQFLMYFGVFHNPYK